MLYKIYGKPVTVSDHRGVGWLSRVLINTMFIAVIAGLLAAYYVSFFWIEGVLMALYTATDDPYYEYLPSLIQYLLLSYVLSIMIHLYLPLFYGRFIVKKSLWIASNAISLVLITLVMYGIFYYYSSLVKNVILSKGRLEVIDRVRSYLSLAVIFIALIYHSLYSVLHVLNGRQYFIERRLFGKLKILFETILSVKGSIVIYVFMGFLLIGLIGLLTTLLAGAFCSMTGGCGYYSIIAEGVVNTILFYTYFQVFINNYVLDIITGTMRRGSGRTNRF